MFGVFLIGKQLNSRQACPPYKGIYSYIPTVRLRYYIDRLPVSLTWHRLLQSHRAQCIRKHRRDLFVLKHWSLNFPSHIYLCLTVHPPCFNATPLFFLLPIESVPNIGGQYTLTPDLILDLWSHLHRETERVIASGADEIHEGVTGKKILL